MPAGAQEAMVTDSPAASGHQKIFVLGGRMGESHFEHMLNPFTAQYDDVIIMGGGYQYFFAEPLKDFKVGLEAGAALRIGDGATGEIWGGVVGRYDGLFIADRFRVSPSLTFGVSAVNATMGAEARRAQADGLPGEVLFYFSPELSFSTIENPDTEIFWRVHHRSGAWNTFGGGGTGESTTIGIRTSF